MGLAMRLRGGELLLGCSLNEARDPGTVHVLGAAGIDVVFLDLEHNLHGPETVLDLIGHARAAGVELLVRPPYQDRSMITRLLDGGCTSLLVPRVRTPAELAEVLEQAYYHPRGRRGVAMVGGAGGGYRPVPDVRAEMARANEATLVGLVVETAEALDVLDELLAEGVGLAVVGFQDLAQALGLPGQPDHPRVREAVTHVRERCLAAGVSYGVFEPSAARIGPEVAAGAQLVVHGGVFAYLRAGVARAVAALDEARNACSAPAQR
ncbi:hypothetical protein GCM10022237_42460 [Nocardioides ginsengisoli]